MTDISADERQALCIDHYEDAVESPGQCFFCGVPYPCETVRLLDALEAAERERDVLREALMGECRECWASQFTCPKCGVMESRFISTKKTCMNSKAHGHVHEETLRRGEFIGCERHRAALRSESDE